MTIEAFCDCEYCAKCKCGHSMDDHVCGEGNCHLCRCEVFDEPNYRMVITFTNGKKHVIYDDIAWPLTIVAGVMKSSPDVSDAIVIAKWDKENAIHSSAT